jgi:ubiquitin C-terminal hydrolase
MNWTIVRVHGVGLINRGTTKESLNICYINSIIQCLANTAPFVQWLLNDDIHDKCELSIEKENFINGNSTILKRDSK